MGLDSKRGFNIETLIFGARSIIEIAEKQIALAKSQTMSYWRNRYYKEALKSIKTVISILKTISKTMEQENELEEEEEDEEEYDKEDEEEYDKEDEGVFPF